MEEDPPSTSRGQVIQEAKQWAITLVTLSHWWRPAFISTDSKFVFAVFGDMRTDSNPTNSQNWAPPTDFLI